MLNNTDGNASPNIRMVSVKSTAPNPKATARPLLVFIHGWPDYADLWGAFVNELYPNYDCLLIELPNYNYRNTKLDFLFGDKVDLKNDKHTYKPKTFPNNAEIMYHISNNTKGIIVSNTDYTKAPSRALNTNEYGWDMCKSIESINCAISNYVTKFRPNDNNVSLIIHDWGSVIGLGLYHTIRLNLDGYSKPRYNIQRFVICNYIKNL